MIKTTSQHACYYVLEPTAARKVAKTVEVSSICYVDIDEKGYPIGVEVILGEDKQTPPAPTTNNDNAV